MEAGSCWHLTLTHTLTPHLNPADVFQHHNLLPIPFNSLVHSLLPIPFNSLVHNLLPIPFNSLAYSLLPIPFNNLTQCLNASLIAPLSWEVSMV